MADDYAASSSFPMESFSSTSYSQGCDVFISRPSPDFEDTFDDRLYCLLVLNCLRFFLPSRPSPNFEDTFAYSLYRRLVSHGLQVFLPSLEMQVVHDIPYQIEQAIRVATVHIAIFFPRYAESNRCLNELLLMVKSRRPILPVLYNVKHSDLRLTDRGNGPYDKALRKHEENQGYNFQTIQNWRDALSHVATLKCFELDAFNGDKADELLDTLCREVLIVLPRPVLNVAKFPTNLDKCCEELERVLSQQQRGCRTEAHVVGIVGLKGVGKTTLAKHFFNRRRKDYAEFSFLSDVRENTARDNLNSLQCKLIFDLKNRDIKIDRVEEGIDLLKKNLSSCHALVILDDIDHVDQLDAFLPIKDVLNPNSLILVTTRDKSVLESANILEPSIYHLEGLDRPSSRQLFCFHAFRQQDPLPGFENLVDGLIEVSGGSPLSLKVLGALLCGKEDIYYWEKTLKKVMGYGLLMEEERQIFLDIACFSIGNDRDIWIEIWGESGWNGLVGFQNLKNNGLVNVDSENRITTLYPYAGMVLAEIDSSDEMRCLKATIKDLGDLLKVSSVRERVRGIRMAPGSSLRDAWDEALCRSKSKMSLDKTSSHELSGTLNLQFIGFEGYLEETIWTWLRSPKLMWLRWNECPYSSLPIPMDHLRVLEVSGKDLKSLWESESQAPMQLRELNIRAPPLKFPKSLGRLRHLVKIVSEETSLATLPEEICYLPCLKHLKLKDYRMLPNSDGELELQLTDGRNSEELSDSMYNLTNLNLTDLEQYASLEMHMYLLAIVWRYLQTPPLGTARRR